jgi:predicted small metal-binding protein
MLEAVTSEDPTPKLAITVDPDIHRQVVEAATAEGVSVSSWMAAAASRELKIRDGLMHEFHCAHQECGSEFAASDKYYLMRQVAEHLKDAHRVDRATETLMTYLESTCVTSWKP